VPRKSVRAILRDFLKIACFSFIIPCFIYLLFLFSFDLLDGIGMRVLILNQYTTGRSAIYIIAWILLALNVPLIFLILGLRNAIARKENRPLFLWTILFGLQRIIAPGPFYPYYWFPLTFSVIILSWFPIKSNIFKQNSSRIVLINICFNIGFWVICSLFTDAIMLLIATN
jgi:hypothetical protein